MRLLKLFIISCTVILLTFLYILYDNNTKSDRSPKCEFEEPAFSDKHSCVVQTVAIEKIIPPKRDKGKTARLNLKLLGTVLGRPTIAYIEDLTSRKKGEYKVGDIVAGAQVIDIKSAEVLLEIDGKREVLVFNHGAEEVITKLSPTEMIISKKGVVEEMAAEEDGLFTMAKISPYFNKEEFCGYRVDDVRKGSMAEIAGLRSGDIIRCVNGQELNSPQRTIQIFRKARNLSKLGVDILRKDRLLKLKYEIKD